MRLTIIDIDSLNSKNLITKAFYLEETLLNEDKGTKYRVLYYKNLDYLLEYIELQQDLEGLDYIIKRNIYDKVILIFNELNEKRLEFLWNLFKKSKDIIIFCENLNITEISFNRNLQVIKNIILLPKLHKDFNNIITIKFIYNIIFFIQSTKSNKDNKAQEDSLDNLDNKKHIYETLRNYRYIQKCEELYITLFSTDELEMKKLNEYMSESEKLEIKNYIDLKLEEFIYFFINITS